MTETTTATAINSTEAKQLQHSMGPSFAFTESLPGVVPVFSGVPYLIVRGASPAGSTSYFDGIPVPSLFHLALGPSLIDPELSGETRFFAGGAPGRYAAHIGGVLERTGPDAHTLATPARNLQLSLLDASGLLNVPTDTGSLAIAWRYGNPGLMLRALGIDATLGYYDYQVRYQSALSSRTQLSVVLMGAGDHLGERTVPSDDIDLSFHRLLGRLTTRIGRVTLGSQLILSSDSSTLGQELSGQALRASEALYMQYQASGLRLRLGVDLTSADVKLERGAPDRSRLGGSAFTRRSRDLALDPEDFLDGQPFSSVPNRNFLGGYAELSWTPLTRLTLDFNLRGDTFLAGSHVDAALAPALRVRVRPSDALTLFGSLALANKPHTSPLPIPGLNDIALDRGVETALQSEVGATLRIGDSLQLEAAAFYHRYYDVVYMELILDCQGNTNPQTVPSLLATMNAEASICRSSRLPTADGASYGIELFAKRDLTQHLSGFLSYTLGFADATARDGTAFTPQSDVRHLVNAVLQYDFGYGLTLGVRLHFRTGKMAVNTIFDVPSYRFARVEYRLPPFFRLDVRLSYAFRVSFGRLEASLGMQNATLSREATNRDCYASTTTVTCEVDYQPYIALPNLGLRADF
ncbi:MAG: TonB-dependent receptor [Polyangiales bacterium]